MPANNRKYPRIKTDRLRIQSFFRGGGASFQVEVLNLSAGGLCLISNGVLRTGDVLLFRFPFKSVEVSLQGRIVRASGREAGVRFMNPENEIKEFVGLFNTDTLKLADASFRPRMKLYFPGGRSFGAGLGSLLDIEADCLHENNKD
ncbi:MAG: PilZ domain-containing protein [Spirochaetes bacterium]|jgi:hypothetical protein|nr:PilZ domain-containing protein [Spirochaetota bacterium]